MLPALVQNPAPVPTPPATVQATVVTKTQRVRVQAPAQDPATVVTNAPHVVSAPLVADVVNAPVVVQQVAVQNVVSETSTPMEVEDEDALLQRLFFKKFGRALPEKEKEKEDEVDNIKFVIDLTDDTEGMEVAAPNPVEVVVKTEPIETPETVANVANVAKLRQERRELIKGRKALIAFGKTLRKTNVIPEKEAPGPENVVADSNVSADASVNPVETAEQTIANSDAIIEASRREFVAEFGDIPMDEFDNTGSEFWLYGSEDVVPSDNEDDAMINNV